MLFDIFDTRLAEYPFPLASEIRETCPVAFHADSGHWLISRYADVRGAFLDSDIFLPNNALSAVSPLSLDASRILIQNGVDLPPILVNNGTPSHSGLRRLVSQFFNGEQLRASIRLITDVTDAQLRDVAIRLRRGDVVDLGATVAHHIPCRVTQRLLDFEDVDVETMMCWTLSALSLFWGRKDERSQRPDAAGTAELYQYLSARIRSTHAKPGSLLEALHHHRTPGGNYLTMAEKIAICYVLIIGGHVTTGQLISSTFRHLLTAQQGWDRARTEPSLVQHLIEEVLRVDPPLGTWRRVTSREVRVNEVEIPEGQQVLLMIAAAGLDPRVFVEPSQLRLNRPNSRKHLAFGAGRHHCLGAEFGRMEAGLVVRRTLATLPPVRLAESGMPGGRLSWLSFRAPLSIPVVSGET